MEGIASTQAQGKHPVQNKDRPTVCLYEEDSGGDQVEQEVPDVKDTLPIRRPLGMAPCLTAELAWLIFPLPGPSTGWRPWRKTTSQYEQGSY